MKFNPVNVSNHRQPVVLVHGMAASRGDWQGMAPGLLAAGYQVHTPDLLGHGDNTRFDAHKDFSADRVYQDFENWLTSLELPPPFWMVGHSLGSYMITRFSLAHPEKVCGLALVNPFLHPRQLRLPYRLMFQQPALGAQLLQDAPRWFIQFTLALAGAVISPRTSALAESGRAAADYKRASPLIVYIPASLADISPELPRLQPPTLIMWGVNDLTINPRSFRRLAQMLPGAQEFPIPGCGHTPHTARPDLVMGRLLEFFGENHDHSDRQF